MKSFCLGRDLKDVYAYKSRGDSSYPLKSTLCKFIRGFNKLGIVCFTVNVLEKCQNGSMGNAKGTKGYHVFVKET